MSIERIMTVLDEMFPNAKAELDYETPFQLLVAVVLSAQTTDKAVNKVTKTLFKAYPDAASLMQAPYEAVISHIESIGLYRNKAKHIIALSNDIMHKYQGEVPNNRAALESLPGVGRKTANVVLSNAFAIPALAVDTHVARIAVRLGLAKQGDDVLKIEQKLNRKFPKDKWLKIHHQLIFFGRYHCLARNPKCQVCPLKDICKFYKLEK